MENVHKKLDIVLTYLEKVNCFTFFSTSASLSSAERVWIFVFLFSPKIFTWIVACMHMHVDIGLYVLDDAFTLYILCEPEISRRRKKSCENRILVGVGQT